MITYLLLNMINNNLYIARILILFLLLTSVGCNTDSTENAHIQPARVDDIAKESPDTRQKPSLVNISLITTDLSSGVNRIAFALVEENTNTLINNASINMRISQLDAKKRKIPDSEIVAIPQPIEIPRGYSHLHEDGATHFHGSGSIGIYISNPLIPRDGHWLIELDVNKSGFTMNINPLVIEVRANSLSPSIGSQPPNSKQVILNEISHISEIDTSSPPDPEMHKITIKDALENGKPTVIVFASPGFCISLTCGTTKLLVDDLYQRYKNIADFIHVEPYDLNKARNNQGLLPIEIMYEWGLRSEPWVFFLDSYGNISGKFEGILTKEELENSFKLISP